MVRRALAGCLALIGMCVLAACSRGENDDRACYAGDFRGCSCGGGVRGYAACRADENGFEACVCNGRIPGLDASPVDASADVADASSEKIPFMRPCERDEQCETGLCFPFIAKGPHCSRRCTSPGDCPPPADGCSNQGVCKVP